MITTNLLINNGNRIVTDTKGVFSIIEYQKDISVSPDMAQNAFFESAMELRKRQLVVTLRGDKGVRIQGGEMQMILGDITVSSDVSSPGDLMKKFVGSKVTGEKTIKPRYTGNGTVVLEPTYRYILLEDLKDWPGGMVLEDGMFLACEDTVNINVTRRDSISSMVLGGEGLFNTLLTGEGSVALESSVPVNELIEIKLQDDVVKLDGTMTMLWSGDLNFTVEKTTRNLVGSIISGECLVNVYRGTGRILAAPVFANPGINVPKQ